MAAVDLEYFGSNRPRWIGMAALAIGVIGIVVAFWYYRDLASKVSVNEELASRLRADQRGKRPSPAAESRDPEEAALEVKEANAAILELSLPWKGLFEAFEGTKSTDVGILAVEPDAQKGIVRIRAEARKLGSMLDYISRLQKLPVFREVVVTSHEIQDQDLQRPIRFVLQAKWGGYP